MTREEAAANQKDLARRYDLSFWYGTWCEPCCGVYPKFMSLHSNNPKDCFYQCEVCGKRTESFTMPWQARDAWNNGEFVEDQIRLF